MATVNNATNQYAYPYYFAYGMSANQVSFPNNTATKINFDTKIIDPNNICIAGTVTFPITGIWEVGAFINISGESLGAGATARIYMPNTLTNNYSDQYKEWMYISSEPTEIAIIVSNHNAGSQYSTALWIESGTIWDVSLYIASQSGLDDMTILKTGANYPTTLFGYLRSELPAVLL